MALAKFSPWTPPVLGVELVLAQRLFVLPHSLCDTASRQSRLRLSHNPVVNLLQEAGSEPFVEADAGLKYNDDPGLADTDSSLFAARELHKLRSILIHPH